MKKLGFSILATVLIFFLSGIIIAPIISNIGYSSVESSYHLVTHSILLSLICTVIYCTMKIIEEINSIKAKLDDDKSNERLL